VKKRNILKSAKIIQENISGISVHRFKNRGHFTYEDMKTDVFLEILNIVLS